MIQHFFRRPDMCNYSDAILRMGEEKGMAQGMAKGENLFAALITTLKEHGRVDDAFRAAADKEYREKFYKEFQLA